MKITHKNFWRWFTPTFLGTELHRLATLFLPDTHLPDVRVAVANSHPDGAAAHAFCNANLVVMYADYHQVRPDEYKTTLLHEAGHFVFSQDHSTFRDFYEVVSRRQRSIAEPVVPPTYAEFLYARPFVSDPIVGQPIQGRLALEYCPGR